MQSRIAFEFLLGLLLGYAAGLFGITGGVSRFQHSDFRFRPAGRARYKPGNAASDRRCGAMALYPTQYIERSAYGRSGNCVRSRNLSRSATGDPFARITLAKGFAVFLAVLATFTIWNAYRKRSIKLEVPWPYAAVIGAGGGFCSGLFGVGGAAFTIPLMTLLFGVSQTEAQGLGLSVILPAILVAIPTYTLAGLADWPTGLALGLGAICTVGLGVTSAHRLPERVLRPGFCVVLYGSAAALWVHG